MNVRHRILLVLALCVAVALPALAGPGDEAMTAAERAEYEKRYNEGLKLLAASRFEDAHALYRELWGKRRSFDVAAQLAQAEMGLGRHRDAAEHFAYAIAFFTPSVRSEPRSVVEKRFQAAKKSVLAVKLDLQPKDASLTVGGSSVELIDGSVYVEPGEREISAQREGFSPASISVSGGAGTETTASIHLKELPGSGLGGGAGTGNDGGGPADAGTSDPPIDDAGSGGSQWPSEKKIAVIVGAGLTVVALGVGIGFKLKGSGADSDADDLLADAQKQFGSQPCASPSSGAASICADIASKRDDADSANGVSNIGFYGAGIFAIGTVAAVLLWPNEEKPARSAVSVSPWFTPWTGSSGLSVSGAF
jgi:hypothetical protein